jgi:hypothetical protein
VINARARFRDRLDAKMKRVCDVTIAYYKHINTGIKDPNKPFDEVLAAAWKETEMNTYSNVTGDKLMKAVYQSVKAVVDAEGLVKTLECLRGLALSQVFDVNKKPKRASEDDEALLKHIGGTEHDDANNLLQQWREYVTEWTQPEQLSPMQVYKYWESKTDEWDVLSPFAMRMFSRPVSAAACERVFSCLTKMDSADRNKMQQKTLANILFLRGNSQLMRAELRSANSHRINAAIAEVGKEKAASAVAFKKANASTLRLASGAHDGDKNDDEVIVDDAAKGPDQPRIKPGLKRLRQAAGAQEQSSDDEKAMKEAQRKKTDDFVSRMKASMKQEKPVKP